MFFFALRRINKKKDGEKKTQDGILLEAISQLGHFHPMAAAQTIGYCHTQPAYRFELFFIFHQSHFLEGVFFSLTRSSHLRFPIFFFFPRLILCLTPVNQLLIAPCPGSPAGEKVVSLSAEDDSNSTPSDSAPIG